MLPGTSLAGFCLWRWAVERAALLFSRGVKYIFLALLPLVLIAVVFAPEGLKLWLGPAFAKNSQLALRLLSAGILINSIATVPFALIQSSGRPDITAKLHLLELPLFHRGSFGGLPYASE